MALRMSLDVASFNECGGVTTYNGPWGPKNNHVMAVGATSQVNDCWFVKDPSGPGWDDDGCVHVQSVTNMAPFMPFRVILVIE